ncbi:MAG: amino acid adenylation domain-containing protein [Rhizobiaceae bacterium]
MPDDVWLPLTEAQEGLWYAQRIDPANPILNCGQYLEIRGPLDVEAFRQAFETVVAETGSLRLRFREGAEGPEQTIDPAIRTPLPFIDLASAPDPQAEALAAIRRDTAIPVDLETGPVAAFHLYRLGPALFWFYERIHHLATDGFAMVLVTNRIAELYSALKGGPAPAAAFPGLDVAFGEDAAYRVSDRREADRAFWLENLAGLPDIGGMAPGRPVSAARFLRETASVSPDRMKALRALADAAKVTWPDALTALVAAYCRRFTGTAEILAGVPFMARLGNPAARVPCMLMNVLPLRLAPDEDRPLGDFLVDVSKTLMRLRRHGRYRSEQLRRELGLVGGQRRLYGPLINVQPFDMPPKMAGLDVRLHILGAGAVDDITFTFRGDASTSLTLEVDANPNLYTEQATRGHAERILAFIDAAAGAATLADIPTASPAEAARVLFDLNATAHPVVDTTLTDLIETTMRETPHATAVVFEDETLTYGELDRRSAALAGRLAALGAGPEKIVAVALPRSVELIVALVATLRAGAAYLPLDLDHPAERLRIIVGSAKPVAVLGFEDSAWLFESAAPFLAPKDWPSERIAPITRARPSDMAYVIYTSGSTGAPKGVVIEHAAIVNRLEWMRAHYGFGPHDRILQKTPATFDVSVWEFFLPLICGAALVVAPPGAHRDPAAIAALIRRERITTCHFVPSMLSAFLASPASAGLAMARVFCSGEELTADQRDRFHRRVDAELHNLYGPTEAAVDVSYWPAARDDRSLPVPIGFPVWNTRLYVLDDRLRLVPPGVAGHLYIAGRQLARCYLGRPDLTAERFVADPFVPGERMYRTGDLARLREDGAVLFLGRSDHQVKIRGLRIELGEIEAAVMASGLATEAGVVAREDRPGDRRIVAYVVPKPGCEAERLKRHLAGLLPDYMIPTAFVEIAALPVTSNGKLDRAALPAPDYASSGGRAAASATERILCGLVADVLGLDAPPSPDTDFFAIGGDSLQAVNLILAIQERFGRDPGLGGLFENPSIAALAAALEAEGDAPDSGLGPLLRLGGGDDDPRPPLFLVHPAGGIAWGYRNLARALAPRRVYGLQSPALDAAKPLPESLEGLADAYVAEILALQPAGPFHLGGWSVGGIVAQAMAARFRALGHTVGVLALLDSYPAECWRAEPEPDRMAALRALLAIAGYDPESYPHLDSRDKLVDFLRRGDSPLGSLPDAALEGVVRSVLGTNRLVRGHFHGRYDGMLTHVRAALDHQGKNLVADLWRSHAGAVDRIDVPFLHPQMISADAAALIAPALERRLSTHDVATEETG